MEKGHVYILEMKNGKYYIGSTNNVERRLKEHQDGKTKSTKYNRPLKLIFVNEYCSIVEARQQELKLKKGKNKQKVDEFMGC